MVLNSKSAHILLATVASYVSALVIAKLVALRYGAEGVGLAGALAGAAAMASSIALLGQLNALPLWSASHPDLAPRATLILSTRVLTVTLPPVLLAGGLSIVSGLQGPHPQSLVWLAFVAFTLAQTAAQLFPAFTASYFGSREVLTLAVLTAVGTMGFTVALVMARDSSDLLVALGCGALLGQMLPLGRVVLIASRQRALRGSTRGLGRLSLQRQFVRLSVSALPGTLVNAIVLGGLPVMVVATASVEVAGLFRAAWAIASIVLAANIALLKNLYFPKQAVLVTSGRDSANLHQMTVGRALGIQLPSLVGVAILGPVILRIFYSSEFAPAASALCLLSILGLMRVGIGINGFWLLSNGRRQEYNAVEVGFMVSLAVGVVWGATTRDVTWIAAAAAVAGVIGLSASLAFVKYARLAQPLLRCSTRARALTVLAVGSCLVSSWVRLL